MAKLPLTNTHQKYIPCLIDITILIPTGTRSLISLSLLIIDTMYTLIYHANTSFKKDVIFLSVISETSKVCGYFP